MAEVSATEIKTRTGTAERRGAGVPLRPSEWDFRGINPNHLDAILFYERARNDRNLKRGQALIKENRRQISSWGAGELAKENLVSQLPGAIPDDDYKCWDIIAACWMCKKFPMPWMELRRREQDEATRRYAAGVSTILGFRILSRTELDRIEATEKSFRRHFTGSRLIDGSKTRIIIEVDWARLDDPVLKPIFAGLVKQRPSGIRPKKRATGKMVAPPFHKLKQLSAWRLQAKYGYKKATQVIADREEAFPKKSEYDSELFPQYQNSGAWYKAVAAGNNFVIFGR